MGDNNTGGKAAKGFQVASIATGLVVFLVGIGMILMAFNLGYGLFKSIDAQLLNVQYVSGLGAGSSESSGSTVALAGPGGPSLAEVGTALALKFVALLVLGWLGAMVASKGAEMTSRSGKARAD